MNLSRIISHINCLEPNICLTIVTKLLMLFRNQALALKEQSESTDFLPYSSWTQPKKFSTYLEVLEAPETAQSDYFWRTHSGELSNQGAIGLLWFFWLGSVLTGNLPDLGGFKGQAIFLGIFCTFAVCPFLPLRLALFIYRALICRAALPEPLYPFIHK